ncbi:MAG TPA: hypothetical protein VNT01_06885 [Symbiobacteriaceae bacterium]|nr:hypothetical protein [Symbiobacteriaceae bacterium]
MAKAVRISDADVIRALEQGAEVLIAGKCRFLLVPVRDDGNEPYDITDPAEAAAIDKALQDPRPFLSGEEARAYVRARLKEHGIG